MLKYLWMVVQDLLVTVTLVTLTDAALLRLFGRRSRKCFGAFVILGVVASAVLAFFKCTTNKIVSSRWNHTLYAIIIALTLGYLIFLSVFRKRDERRETLGLSGGFACLFGSALSAVLIFYALPGVMLYPINFNTMGNGYLSSYYLVRMLGWLCALLLLVIYARCLSQCALQIQPRGAVLLGSAAGAVTFAVYCFGRFFIPWVNRAKWLNWPVKYDKSLYGWAGDMMMFTANHSMLFIWTVAFVAAALVVAGFVQNVKIHGKYENPAQKRKLRAAARRIRRIAGVAATVLVAFVVILTAVKGYDTRVIELSAPENFTVEGDKVLVPLESVNDGHLHRFEYRTENGIDVRWIVVRKPNAASYGVGLDACEVCGNAGYFERNGQVVCRRCDVVMNINTIGFKGGCNPIPLSYEVGDGCLIFNVSDLVAGEKEFK